MNTLAAIARKYLARTTPGALAQSFPLFLENALRAALTATSTSSVVAAGISPDSSKTYKSLHQFLSKKWSWIKLEDSPEAKSPH